MPDTGVAAVGLAFPPGPLRQAPPRLFTGGDFLIRFERAFPLGRGERLLTD